ncbi:hypothetical protein BDA96_08G093200 [Sorghum bicolor]|uniref:Uncharacterized protein n=1 Tax=Sorghum bicolor TaxID=4558 RepID=A0A921U7J7_SORBI|nr:hypothetical protein BDA96_08G093200 [Sorghum bicolor]
MYFFILAIGSKARQQSKPPCLSLSSRLCVAPLLKQTPGEGCGTRPPPSPASTHLKTLATAPPSLPESQSKPDPPAARTPPRRFVHADRRAGADSDSGSRFARVVSPGSTAAVGELFWAPAPLTTKSWADVEDDDDDDYFATTAPPRPVWGTADEPVKEEEDVEDVVRAADFVVECAYDVLIPSYRLICVCLFSDKNDCRFIQKQNG